MRQPLVIVGGRGSGEMAMSVFEAANSVDERWAIEGYLNDIGDPDMMLGRYPVLGPSAAAAEFAARGYAIHYALLFNAKKKEERVAMLEAAEIPPEAHASAVHPTAHLDPSVEIGYGTLIDACVGTSVNGVIGNHVHMYQHSYLNHEAVLSDYTTVAPHAVIGGRVEVGVGAHVGLNASIIEDVTIGAYAIVGMGAVVLSDVAERRMVGGNPAVDIGAV